jgi:hypothetical protein
LTPIDPGRTILIMPQGKRPTTYRDRVLAYCKANGIDVPKNFDVSKATDAIVAIDVSAKPHKLASRSTYQWKDALKFVRAMENRDKSFRVLDFKRCCELEERDGRLIRGASFEGKLPNEKPYLVDP